jgi:tyrosinase
LAGTVALFGLRRASASDGSHGGEGLSFELDITNIIDTLHLDHALDVESLDVKIMPDHAVSEDAAISVGRVSIYRQGLR